MPNAPLHAPVQPVAGTAAPAVDIRGLAKSYGDELGAVNRAEAVRIATDNGWLG